MLGVADRDRALPRGAHATTGLGLRWQQPAERAEQPDGGRGQRGAQDASAVDAALGGAQGQPVEILPRGPHRALSCAALRRPNRSSTAVAPGAGAEAIAPSRSTRTAEGVPGMP